MRRIPFIAFIASAIIAVGGCTPSITQEVPDSDTEEEGTNEDDSDDSDDDTIIVIIGQQ